MSPNSLLYELKKNNIKILYVMRTYVIIFLLFLIYILTQEHEFTRIIIENNR